MNTSENTLCEVLDRIAKTYKNISLGDDTPIKNMIDHVIDHYSSRTRYYHNAAHVVDMLSEFYKIDIISDKFSNPTDIGTSNQHMHDGDQNEAVENLEIAIVFHDVIYNPWSKNNEFESGQMCKLFCKLLGFSIDRIDEINHLILATDYNRFKIGKAMMNDSSNLIRDIDLSHFGRKDTVWLIYILQDLRQEYYMYENEEWLSGTKMFLNELINIPEIYKTKFYSHLNPIAHDHLDKLYVNLSESPELFLKDIITSI